MAEEHGASRSIRPASSGPGAIDVPHQDTRGSPRLGIRATLLSWYINGVPHHFGKSTATRLLARLCRNRPVRSKYGVLLYPSATDKTNTYGLLGSTYGGVADEIRRLAPGMRFVDIGANCGVFTLMAAAQVGPTGLVIAFEPSMREFASLNRNLVANRADNVLALPFALHGQTGPVAFTLDPGRHSGTNAIMLSGGTGHAFGLHPDDFQGLAAFIGERRVVLKLDVEGYEVKATDALAGFVRTQRVEKVIVEVDSRQLARYGDTPATLYERLDALGYAPTIGAVRHHYDEVFVRRPIAPRERKHHAVARSTPGASLDAS